MDGPDWTKTSRAAGSVPSLTSKAAPSSSVIEMAESVRSRVSFGLQRVGDREPEDERHSFAVNVLAWSSSKRRLYSGGRDCTIREWDAQGGVKSNRRKFAELHSDWITDLSLAGEDSHLLSSSHDGSIKLWSLETGELVNSYFFHSDYVKALSVSAHNLGGSQMVCSAGLDGRMFLWDVSQDLVHVQRDSSQSPFAHVFQTSSNLESIYALKMTPGASLVFAGTSGGFIRIFDVASGEKLGKLRGHSDCVKALAINSPGTQLVSSGSDKHIKLWDLRASHRPVTSFQNHQDTAWSLHCRFDEHELVSTGRDGYALTTDLRTLQSRILFEESSSILCSVVSTTEGGQRQIWTSVEAAAINVHVEADGRFSRLVDATISAKPGIVKSEVLADKRRIVSLRNDGEVELWDVTRAARIQKFKNESNLKPEEFFTLIQKDLDTKVSIPQWFTHDHKSGDITIHLEFPSCYNCEVGIRDSGFPAEIITLRSEGQKDEESINIGERVLACLFKTWVEALDKSVAATFQEHTSPVEVGESSPENSPLEASVSEEIVGTSQIRSFSGDASKGKSKWYKFGEGAPTTPSRTEAAPSIASLLHGVPESSFYKNFYKNRSNVSRGDEGDKKVDDTKKENKRMVALDLLPSYEMPPSTPISVSEVDAKTKLCHLLFRSSKSNLRGVEQVPQWVFDALFERHVPCETPYRLPLVLSTEDDSFPSKGKKKKFLAPRTYRMSRISRWIADSLELEPPSEPASGNKVPFGVFIQILCRDKIMDPDMTLASVKHFHWKSGADIALTYRMNDNYKKK